jgi:hypothetical protein
MKTKKDWIDTLPEDIRERAYNYTEKSRQGNLEYSLFEAILGAFLWDKTSEGHNFWLLVAMGKFDQARQLLINKTNTTKP